MHTKCQCLLIAPVFTAELGLFSLLAASKDPERALAKACHGIDEYLAPGGVSCRLPELFILFLVPSPEGQTPQNPVLPGNSVFAFAVINTPFPFPQALPYVCLLIAMLFFIYAIIGMQVKHLIL